MNDNLQSLDLGSTTDLEELRNAIASSNDTNLASLVTSLLETLETKLSDAQEINSQQEQRILSLHEKKVEADTLNATLLSVIAGRNKQTADLRAQQKTYLKRIEELESQNILESTTATRLAVVNAVASESLAELEERDTLLVSMNNSLAEANAHGAELVCELEEKTLELQKALERVRVLQGLISICMHCHKIRDDGDVWNRLEEYMSKHSDVRFSHGLCPPCLEQHYGEE